MTLNDINSAAGKLRIFGCGGFRCVYAGSI